MMKAEKMEIFKPQFNLIMDGINKMCAAISESLKELYGSEPDEEVHPGLMKSAAEARKLLYDKVSRATSYIERRPEFTKEALLTFDERLSKAINIIADAMKTHGRYVRAVFGQKSADFESCLRELHELSLRTHASVEKTVKEIQLLDSILSEISLYEQILQDKDRINDDIKLLQGRAKSIADILKDEASQLTELKSCEEFKRATDSVEEFERTAQEIKRVKSVAAGLITEMSRPFRKMEKLIKSGGHTVAPEVLKILEICITDPSDVISSDENIVAFDKLLREISELANTGKIDLDKRERKKLLDAVQSLAAGLKAIKNNLTNLTTHAEAKKRASENPVIVQAGRLEDLIKQHEHDLKEVHAAIEQLDEKFKLMQEKLVSKKENLKKLSSDAMGTKVELTS